MTVFVVYPVEKDKLSKELTPEKVDFNDLLKDQGVSLVLARVSEQVPVEIAHALSHRENQEEKTHETTKDVSANKNATLIPQLADSTKHIQTQEKPLEKDVEVSDGEKLKQQLFEKQADLIMNHRRRLGRDNELFKRQFNENPELAIDAQRQMNPALKEPLEFLEKQFTHQHELSKNTVPHSENGSTQSLNDEASKKSLLEVQADLIMRHRQKLGRDNDLFKRQFNENPEMAVEAQKMQSRVIADLLDGKVPASRSLKRDDSHYWSKPSISDHGDSSMKTEKSKVVEKSNEQETQFRIPPSLER